MTDVEEATKDFVITKEDLEFTLTRTIDFVRNCDSKAAVFLGISGVALSIILTTDGINNIKSIILSAYSNQTFCNVVFLLLLSGTIILTIIGLFMVGKVLGVQIDFSTEIDLDCDSKIFFEHIKRNGQFVTYKQKLSSLTEVGLLNDIASQIYINSCICSDKYRFYKLGTKMAFTNFFVFLCMWGIGSIVY